MQKPGTDTITVLLLSDSTGETVRAAANAAFSMFGDLHVTYKLHPFVRTEGDLVTLDDATVGRASIIAYTVANPGLKRRIEAMAASRGIPAIGLLDPLIEGIANVLGRAPTSRAGSQYHVDKSYLDRVSAIDFAIGNDDGLSADHLLAADVILTGVSRTSKTPTCIYLGYQGFKAANVPLILNQDPAPHLLTALHAGVPVIGLTANPMRLAQVRQTRLRALGNPEAAAYSDRAHIEEELVAARLFFDRYKIPVIDVTRRSIEETAASVRQFLERAAK